MKKLTPSGLIIVFSALILAIPTIAIANWQESMNQSWEKAKDSTLGLYKDYFPENKVSVCTESPHSNTSTTIDNKWEQLLKQLELSSQKFQQIRKAPSNSWFGEDKKSLAIEFNALMDQTIQLLLEDTPSLACLQKQHQQVALKNQLQNQLTHARESLIISSGDKKQELKQYVIDILDNLAQLEQQKQQVKDEMRLALIEQGLNLSPKQLDMLLARVDAKDIIQMSVIFDAVKSITLQLEKLMQANADNLSASKKYYAMYVVLSEMIVYIQENYTAQLENDYLPGIKTIMDQTKQVQRETSSLLRSATSNRKSVYQHNLQAQKLTLKTADLYYNHLQKQLKRIEQATKIAQKDLQMAKNTFETVQLSIELLNLIKTNRNNFQQLLQLQLPELVPLSNIAMEKEYQRLTIKLSE